jgi:arylsulfatase A-like enzyme
MSDDQGWGDVGYHGHPVLKTPVMDEMAAAGLRFERFYSASPVCSPTRGSVLTGRHPNRFGCFSWGHTLRPREITLARVLRDAGYATGHFGKWHLGPVRAGSPVSPGASGFDEWVSSPNFYENSPLMSRKGKVVRTEGEGSQVTVDFALEFIRAAVRRRQPFLAVVWFGSPHGPYEALEPDRQLYRGQTSEMQNYCGEITAMDRAIGNLRRELRRLDAAEDTLLWFNSDNGAIGAGSTGGLAGRKATLMEGGIRVPATIEWPARIRRPRTIDIPCNTSDIYPTLLEIAGARPARQVQPLDGISLLPLIEGRTDAREKPMGFWDYPEPGIGVSSAKILREMEAAEAGQPPPPAPDPAIEKRYPEDRLSGQVAWIDGPWKLLRKAPAAADYELFNLSKDPRETVNLASREPERASRMKSELEAWQRSVVRSLNGGDYR